MKIYHTKVSVHENLQIYGNTVTTLDILSCSFVLCLCIWLLKIFCIYNLMTMALCHNNIIMNHRYNITTLEYDVSHRNPFLLIRLLYMAMTSALELARL